MSKNQMVGMSHTSDSGTQAGSMAQEHPPIKFRNYMATKTKTAYSTDRYKDCEIVSEMKRMLDREEREVQVQKQGFMLS